jgi:DNA-binding NtrC family response regulator
LLSDGAVIGLAAVSLALGVDTAQAVRPSPAAAGPTPTPASATAPGQTGPLLRDVERAALLAQLQAHAGSRAALARQLGISERSLYRKLRRLQDETP